MEIMDDKFFDDERWPNQYYHMIEHMKSHDPLQAIHMVPIGDAVGHDEASRDCICGPVVYAIKDLPGGQIVMHQELMAV